MIDFDDSGLVKGSDITTYYAALGVTFYGIANPFPIGPGPFPVPTTLPAIIGGAEIWNPGHSAPGGSPPNIAVGVGDSDPGDAGILMTFSTLISSLEITGLDWGDNGNDGEEMTLSAYDSSGDLLGYQHYTVEFASGAIRGSIAFPNMQYVAFNYTDTLYGFYGIDDLEFTPATSGVPDGGATLALLGVSAMALGVLRRKMK